MYSQSQVFPVQLDYEWGAKFVWRRVGHNLAPTTERPEPAALTVMIWEGLAASADDIHTAEAIVESVSVSVSAGVLG